AFVVTGAGELLVANSEAQQSIDGNDAALRARWRKLAEGRIDPEYTAISLGSAGLVASKALITRRQSGRDFESMLEEARQAWRLTARHKDVLRQVLKGASNKEIGAVLGCTEGTVENHMSSMLRRAGADSRTTLVAKFWGVREGTAPRATG
ncbi:MAG: hypothetical protein KA745_14265, partial [Gemmatimonadales bacterium]|nr:hypothetical protein [Gemmatimonadales bacterium]